MQGYIFAQIFKQGVGDWEARAAWHKILEPALVSVIVMIAYLKAGFHISRAFPHVLALARQQQRKAWHLIRNF